MPRSLQLRKIDNVLTEGDADPRRSIARLENTEGQILQRKMRI
jgi:hypothetical protein